MSTFYVHLPAAVGTLGSLAEASTVIIITSSGTRMSHPAGTDAEWFVPEV